MMNWFYPSVAGVALAGIVAISLGGNADPIVGLCLGAGFFMVVGKLLEMFKD